MEGCGVVAAQTSDTYVICHADLGRSPTGLLSLQRHSEQQSPIASISPITPMSPIGSMSPIAGALPVVHDSPNV